MEGLLSQRKVKKLRKTRNNRNQIQKEPTSPSPDSQPRNNNQNFADEHPPEDDESDTSGNITEDDVDDLHQRMFSQNGIYSEFVLPPNKSQSHKHYVFGKKTKLELNRIAGIYGRMLQHQSDREFDRSFFASGICSVDKREVTKKFGHEERCILLLYLLILCSPFGHNEIEPVLSEQRMSLFIVVISHCLMLEHFMRSHSVTKKNVKLFQDYIPMFLSCFKEATRRTKGDGLTFIKFHLLIHLFHDIIRYGPCSVFDSSVGECHHVFYKHFGINTQQNSDTFEVQVGDQEECIRPLQRAAIEIGLSFEEVREMRWHGNDVDETLEECNTTKQDNTAAVHCYVNETGFFNIPKNSFQEENPIPSHWQNKRLQQQVHEFLTKNVLPHTVSTKLELPTQSYVKGQLYRADPCAVTHYNRGRHDWVNIKWDEADGGPMPARLITFVRIQTNDVPVPRSHQDCIFLDGDGVYAVIQSLGEGLYGTPNDSNETNFRAHQSSSLIYYSELISDDGTTPDLHLVKVAPKTFDHAIIALPYDVDDTVHELKWLFVEPRFDWDEIYTNCIEEMLQKVRKESP